MSVATTILPTPSTSLILIRNLSTPTVVQLSTFYSPNFTISIRDTTGLSNIQTSSIKLSTIGSLRFLDGTNEYFINQPYGFVNVAFRNSSFWQIVHTSGQAPATAAATVNVLTTSTLNAGFLSTGIKFVSSLTIRDLVTNNSFSLTSPFVITNLSAPGIVVVQSTFNAYGDVLLDKQLYVSGPTIFRSSLFVNTVQPISSVSRIISSVGVGGTLSVGGILTVGSTFQTFSTNTVQNIQIQKSSTDTVFEIIETGVIQQRISTLLNVTATNSFVTLSSLQIYQNVSSLSETFSTKTLDVRGPITFFGALSSLGNVTFLSSLNVKSTLTITDNLYISTNLFVKDNVFTQQFSSLIFSTLGSLSTRTLFVTSTAFLSSGLSTAILQGYQWVSIGSDFYTPGIVSSLTLTKVGNNVSTEGKSLFGSIHVSSSVGVGNHLTVQQSSFLGSVLFEKNVSTLGDFYTLGYTEIQGNVGVGQNFFVNSNIVVLDGSEISSFFVNSFLLSNLDIMTSSPFTAFTASTLNASSIVTTFTEIGITNPPELFVYSTFASTTRLAYAEAENIRVQTVRASNVLFGPKQTTLDANANPRFVMNSRSLFPQGLSAPTVRFDNLLTNNIQASFLGDGANIVNAAVPYSLLSALKTYASTSIPIQLFASTMNVSSFEDSRLTAVISTFITPYLVLESLGFPERYDTNQILVKNTTTMLVNRALTFDRLRNRVGIQMAAPQYDLDVDGQIFASNIYYSSIQSLSLTTLSTFTLSSIRTSSVLVKNNLAFGVSGMQIMAYNSVNQDATPFEIQVTSKTSNLFGIYSYPSSIGIMNSLQVQNNTQRVSINGLSSGIFLSSPHDLNVYYTMVTGDGYFSTVNYDRMTLTKQLISPSLFLQGSNYQSTNTMSTGNGYLYLNKDLMTVTHRDSGAIGIKTVLPVTSLDVRGNAYFSSVSFTGIAKANFLTLGTQFA